jgi:adenine-specific DNA-methyltransferase
MAKIDFTKLTKAALINYITQQPIHSKFGLVWEQPNIPETVILECANAKPILKEVKNKAIAASKKQPNHILIEGDNYHALSALQATHQQKIDIIYIDPPYNTGKANDFLYNDKYVDNDDVYKHSKWLSFMQHRLQLAYQLLSKDGVIFISIDDNEIAQLKLLCIDIFGENNFVAQFIRKNKAGSGHDSNQIAVEFDYMLCFAKNKASINFTKEIVDVENDKKYRYTDEYVAHRGKYYLRDLDYKGSYSPSLDYALTVPDGSTIYAGAKKGKPNTWRWSKEKLAWGVKHDFIVFKKVKDHWKVYIKQYQFVDNNNEKRVRALPHRAIIQYLNAEGSQQLNQIVPQQIFKFPKPIGLIEFCIQLIDNKNALVLDFFAGSGTTGHAVLAANAKDKGNRQFIICTNNENQICETITYPRIVKAIKGYTDAKNKKIAALGGALTYYQTAFLKN